MTTTTRYAHFGYIHHYVNRNDKSDTTWECDGLDESQWYPNRLPEAVWEWVSCEPFYVICVEDEINHDHLLT